MRLIEMAYPTVVKVGNTHAGFGKFVAKSQSEYNPMYRAAPRIFFGSVFLFLDTTI